MKAERLNTKLRPNPKRVILRYLDIQNEYRILISELEKFNNELLDKKRVVVISKSDLLDDELKKEIAKELPSLPWIFISAITGENIDQLKDILWKQLNS